MRTLCLLSLCLALPAFAANTAKIFTDKGSTYFRTDNKKALAVGAELDVVADAKSDISVGKAVIMEVNGALARVSLDDDATKAGAKFVLLPKAGAGGAEKVEAKSDMTAPPLPPPRAPGAKLNGRLEVAGLHFKWNNDSDSSWTGCTLVHSDSSSYDVGEVVKHSEDGVLRVKLMSPPEPAFDHVVVNCEEGEARFWFDNPQKRDGKLKGYATKDGGGIILYNQNETAWTTCDVRKPNGTHYVLGTLKGHSDDSIAANRFKKEEENKPKWLELRCKEGDLHTAL